VFDGLNRSAQPRDHCETGPGHVIRRFPRIDFMPVDSPVVKQRGVPLSILVVHETVHHELGFKLEGLPILGLSGELIGVEERD
jgi:hypothetical protein